MFHKSLSLFLVLVKLVNAMGFFDKLKSFGSKIVKGIRKGWDFVRDRVAPVVRKILPVARTVGTVVGGAIGGPGVAAGVDKAAGIIDKGLSFIGR